MIDRALAEDLAAIFEVRVTEIPTDISLFIAFLNRYIDEHSDEGLDMLKFRFQVVAGRIHDLIEKMADCR